MNYPAASGEVSDKEFPFSFAASREECTRRRFKSAISTVQYERRDLRATVKPERDLSQSDAPAYVKQHIAYPVQTHRVTPRYVGQRQRPNARHAHLSTAARPGKLQGGAAIA